MYSLIFSGVSLVLSAIALRKKAKKNDHQFVPLWRVSCELVGQGWCEWQKDVFFDNEEDAQRFIKSECLQRPSVKPGKRIFKCLDYVLCVKYDHDVFCCGSPVQVYCSQNKDAWKWPKRLL